MTTTDTGPQTEAGREMYRLIGVVPEALDRILAIEAEAQRLTVERLANALHDAMGVCHWQPHSGFRAKTHEEYHRQQAKRIIVAALAHPEEERSGE